MKYKGKIVVTNSLEETQKLGEEFVRRLHLDQGVTLTRNVVALYGDLGSGKTTFVQGIAKGLGIKRRIISPTFIIARSYKLKAQSEKRKTTAQNLKLFYHIDLYRVSSEKYINGLGLDEIINNPENIVVIEWAEKMGKLLPIKRWDVRFEYLDGNRRRITIVR